MMGTPAYMAPEQFFGKATDARTDQFSFCVALYEALYGERPFAGKKLTELTANVVQGTVRDAPAGTKVPFWVRRILLRGLRSAPAERYPSMAEMLDALGKDPARARRKWWRSARRWRCCRWRSGSASARASRSARHVRRRRRKAGGHLGACTRPINPRGRDRRRFTPPSCARERATPPTSTRRSPARSPATRRAGPNMYKQTCEATQVRHEQSADVLDLRMSCLNERLNGFHALTDVFADATGEVVENAVSATNALATLDRCADVPTCGP